MRQLAPDVTVADVVRRMPRAEAIGLLYDGAGWDVSKIAAELELSPRQVRLDVAKARLAADKADCEPCLDQLDGLMTFSADAMDHSMTCAECKATRRALRAGKLELRDRWNRERGSETPTKPLPSPAVREVRARVAGPPPDRRAPAPRRDHHERPRRPAIDLTASPVRPTIVAPPSVASPSVAPPASQQREPRPTGPVLSLPDRSPGRTRLPQPDLTASTPTLPQRAPVSAADRQRLPRVRHLIGMISAMLITLLSPRRVVLALLVVGVAGGATVIWNINSAATVQPQDARSDVGPAPAADSAPQVVTLNVDTTPLRTPTPTPTRLIVPTELPPPENPSDPTITTWQELAACESSSNWGINSGNGFYGGLQFTLESWHLVGGKGYPHHHPALEQIRRAERLLDLQGWVAWPVCSVELGLR